MLKWKMGLLSLVAVFGLLLVGDGANAQLGKLKDKAKKKVEEKVEKKVDESVDQALEGKGEQEKAGDTLAPAGSEEAPETEASAQAGETSAPDAGPWVNYDFVPGEKVLFYEDFSTNPVGDFPQRLEFISGNVEVAEWKGQRWARIPEAARFEIRLPDTLPDRFTIEFKAYLPDNAYMHLFVQDPSDPSIGPLHADFRNFWLDVYNYYTGIKASVRTTDRSLTDEEVDGAGDEFNLRVMVSQSYLKVYVNETRVANIPKVPLYRSNVLAFLWDRADELGMFVTDVRVGAGGKVMLYDRLMADGRATTHGILFDSGSDRLRPESTPTLKEMGQMMSQHADLRLVIEGHTDSEGDDAFNQSLSEKRAAAVKAFLVEKYGIDAARLEAKGYGESTPVDSNDTQEGRQNNRRVELVKVA